MKAPDPITLFGEWFKQANDAGLLLPEAMTLATSTRNGYPSARTVLLKHFDKQGFTFFTNYTSRKSREMKENPKAALLFHWASLERQVRIEGRVTVASRETSAAYFSTRPRGSRIGAWASRQSTILPDRATLESRVSEIEKRFSDQDVPLPPFWGGWHLKPEMMEFWSGKTSRLHDRKVYTRSEGQWKMHRLYP